MTNYNDMNKEALRKECKAKGVKYGKMNVQQMKDALNQIPTGQISESSPLQTRTVKAYKVFNPDWTCSPNGNLFQYEMGKVFKEDGEPVLCMKGFHACVKLADCFNYYPFNPENKVAEVLLSGRISEDRGDKICSDTIELVREISWLEVLTLVNTGNYNIGYCNTSNYNTGNRNTGNCNTGYCNTGNRNTGDWNKVNKETGYFNTLKTETIRVFNKPCPIDVWENRIKPSFLYFNLTEWVYSCNMTKSEKESNPSHTTTGGYLRKLDYKEQFKKSYENASNHDIKLLKALPNFDKKVFFEISGIMIED